MTAQTAPCNRPPQAMAIFNEPECPNLMYTVSEPPTSLLKKKYSISRQGSGRLDLDVDRDVEPRWPLSRVVRLACCRTNLVKERRVALWSARNRIRRVGTKALFRDRKPHFVPVLPNLYVNRIYSILRSINQVSPALR